jgi:hypothetical protein
MFPEYLMCGVPIRVRLISGADDEMMIVAGQQTI